MEATLHCNCQPNVLSEKLLVTHLEQSSGTGINGKRHDARPVVNSSKHFTVQVIALLSLKQSAYLHHAEHSDGIQVIKENPCHFIN